ncbi:hypothetical protein VSDG_00333 [Cytospora chrysosperma]|uniref:Apple domain-containing protein n=1 Tax=Cytospora chrysosperma TaxID=252740 RepID=A0A423WP46_CYTCH|nr:hypothetical protein VSDG_00333 [Valsa sordida]
MDSKQVPHDAPELAHSNYPEPIPPQQQQYQYIPYQQYPPPQQPPVRPADVPGGSGGPYSAYSDSQLGSTSPQPYHTSPVAAGAVPSRGGGKRKGTLCGCPVLEFVLCAIIALLSAAVIGLAAGTGVKANQANEAERRVAQLSASLASATATATATGTATTASSTATSTSYDALDLNCSSNPDGVTGTTYDAFSLIGNYTFTIQCNKDAPGNPLMVLFTSDIDTCMDACASYDKYSTSSNSTCGSVSFIPLWTDKSDALKGGAPGNCYLKPAQSGDLDDPNIGTECHAAVLTAS